MRIYFFTVLPIYKHGNSVCYHARFEKETAALNFVFMPPVPRLEPAPPAREYTSSSICSIRFINFALVCRRRSASYRPSISERMTNSFALHKTNLILLLLN